MNNPPAGGFPQFFRILAVITITFIVIVIAPEAGAHEPDTFVNAAQPAVDNATALKTAASSSGSDTQKCVAMLEKTLGMMGPRKNEFCGCYRDGVVKNVKAGWFNNDLRTAVHKECAVKFPD